MINKNKWSEDKSVVQIFCTTKLNRWNNKNDSSGESEISGSCKNGSEGKNSLDYNNTWIQDYLIDYIIWEIKNKQIELYKILKSYHVSSVLDFKDDWCEGMCTNKKVWECVNQSRIRVYRLLEIDIESNNYFSSSNCYLITPYTLYLDELINKVLYFTFWINIYFDLKTELKDSNLSNLQELNKHLDDNQIDFIEEFLIKILEKLKGWNMDECGMVDDESFFDFRFRDRDDLVFNSMVSLIGRMKLMREGRI